ncbi:MAG: TonB-dependent receptor [Bacteroidales bacterium]
MMMRSVILFASLILSTAVSAQEHRIKGRVLDDQGLALAGANIRVSDTYLGVVTDRNGQFVLKVPANEYAELSVSFVGFETLRIPWDKTAGDSLVLKMTPSVFLGDEVVVRATRADRLTPMAYENMDAEEIKDRNMGQDMGYLLSLTPSLVQSSESGTGIGYTNFRIRGSDPSRINITVDGIPLNDPESQQVFWVNMPAFTSSLGSIQIQRGIGTSGNGAAAFGATVNLQTESPRTEAHGSLSSTIGSYHTFIHTIKAGTGLIADRLALDMRYSTLQSDGYVDHTFSDNRSAQFTGTYFLEKGRIKANVILGEQHSGIGWWGIDKSMLAIDRTYNPAGQYTTPDGEARYYENQSDNYWQNHYHLVYATRLSPRLNLHTALFYVDGKGYYEQYKQDQDLSEYYLPPVIAGGDSLFASDLIRQKWLDNDFLGSVFSLQYRNGGWSVIGGGGMNRYLGDHFGRIIWMRHAGNTEKDHEWYRNQGSKQDGNLYLKSTFSTSSGLTLFGDLQYRHVRYRMDGIDDDGYLRDLEQAHRFHFFNPKAGIQMQIDPVQHAYASLAIGHREPTRQNFKDATGDPDATPLAEELRDLELGYELRLPALALAANLYFMDYLNQLVPTGELSTDGYPVMSNVDRSYRTGLELSAGIEPLSFLQWNANLTLSRNRIRNFVESYVDYDTQTWEGTERTRDLGDTPLAYSPGVIGNSDLCLTVAGALNIHWISQYVGEQSIVNTGNPDMKIDPGLSTISGWTCPLPGKGWAASTCRYRSTTCSRPWMKTMPMGEPGGRTGRNTPGRRISPRQPAM